MATTQQSDKVSTPARTIGRVPDEQFARWHEHAVAKGTNLTALVATLIERDIAAANGVVVRDAERKALRVVRKALRGAIEVIDQVLGK